MLRHLPLLLMMVLLPGVAGCDRDHNREKRLVRSSTTSVSAGQPFGIGAPDSYVESKVYDAYRRSHGIWIVSRPTSSGTMIVVLDAIAPDAGSSTGTRYNSITGRFECPVTGSRFTSDGLLSGSNGYATHSLVRLRVELVQGQLRVDPTRRFAHESNEWSNPLSMHILGSPDHPDRADAAPRSPFAPNLTPTHSLK